MRVVTDAPDQVTVAVRGELDLFTRARLAAELERQRQEPRDVVLDLQQLEFMDCGALAMVLAARRRGELEILAPVGGSARMLLNATGQAL